jgi:hypothetical protein
LSSSTLWIFFFINSVILEDDIRTTTTPKFVLPFVIVNVTRSRIEAIDQSRQHISSSICGCYRCFLFRIQCGNLVVCRILVCAFFGVVFIIICHVGFFFFFYSREE